MRISHQKAREIMNASLIRKAVLGLSLSVIGSMSLSTLTVGVADAHVVIAKPQTLPRMGESGPEVIRLQQAIVARGFTIKGGVDGTFGTATRTALRSLQRVAGFRATGNLDSRTAKFLGLVDVTPLSKNSFPTIGSSGDAVWSIQQALINSGVTVKGGADGRFGLATSIAIGRFQAARGLSVTKSVNEGTAIALGLLPAPAQKTTTQKTQVAAALIAPAAASVAASTSITIDSLPARGQTSEAVRIVQNALVAAGIEVKGGADAVFGAATSIAIGKFQSSKGLNVTTALDASTAVALGLIPTLAELGLPSLQAFPMQGRCSFSDSWHAPRGSGRLHEGVDIIGARGLAIYAVVDGIITRMLSGGALSGNSIRLTAPDGTYFFYAHMDGFATGLSTGQTVRAGQIIGYNGSTGTSSPHLHFEIHPRGGAAINPYPIVKAIDACNNTSIPAQP